MQLILGSSSPCRKTLLDQLQIPYQIIHPNIDETPRADETALDLVQRLALAKAMAIGSNYPASLIIGCDQVAVLDSSIIGKPYNHAAAHQQLSQASGKIVQFLSALCLLNTQNGQHQLAVVPITIKYRKLSPQQIENYLRKDQPYRCAGSIKSEKLGVALFESVSSEDPSALLGLPLIRLVDMLLQEGLDVLE